MDAFMNVLTLCNYCILSNVLDPRTYNFADLPYGRAANATHLSQRQQHDYNALSPDDRRYFSYVRGLAINLIHWINCHYVFEGSGPNDPITTARVYLHHQIRAIVHYKITAEKENVQGVPNCMATDLRRQISLLFADGASEFGDLSLTELTDAESLAWETGLTPKKRGKPLDFTGINYFHYHGAHIDSRTEREPLALETTRGDKMFHAGSAHGFPLSSVSNPNTGDSEFDDDVDIEMDLDWEAHDGEMDRDQAVGDNEKAGEDDEGDNDEEDDDEEAGDDGNDTPGKSSDMEYDNWELKKRR